MLLSAYRIVAYKSEESTPETNPQSHFAKRPLPYPSQLPLNATKDEDYSNGKYTTEPRTRATLPADLNKMAGKDSTAKSAQRPQSDDSAKVKRHGFCCSLPAPPSPESLRKELSSGSSVDYVEMDLPLDTLKELGQSLAEAINSGNKEKAELYAGRLAMNGAEVNITVSKALVHNGRPDTGT